MTASPLALKGADVGQRPGRNRKEMAELRGELVNYKSARAYDQKKKAPAARPPLCMAQRPADVPQGIAMRPQISEASLRTISLQGYATISRRECRPHSQAREMQICKGKLDHCVADMRFSLQGRFLVCR